MNDKEKFDILGKEQGNMIWGCINCTLIAIIIWGLLYLILAWIGVL